MNWWVWISIWILLQKCLKKVWIFTPKIWGLGRFWVIFAHCDFMSKSIKNAGIIKVKIESDFQWRSKCCKDKLLKETLVPQQFSSRANIVKTDWIKIFDLKLTTLWMNCCFETDLNSKIFELFKKSKMDFPIFCFIDRSIALFNN